MQQAPVPFGASSDPADAAVPRLWIFQQESGPLEVSFELIASRSLIARALPSILSTLHLSKILYPDRSFRFVPGQRELALSGNEHYTRLISCARCSGHWH